MEKIDYKGHVIGIYNDDLSEDNPRDWEPLGIVISFMKRDDFSDNNAPKINTDDFGSLEEIERHLIKKEGAVVILPIYALIHSGTTISTKPFNDPWDSGQAGFIYTTRERILKQHPGAKVVTKKLKDDAARTLEGEIEYLDIYLRGDGYGYVIDPVDDDDTCGPSDEYCGSYFERCSAEEDAKHVIDRWEKIKKEKEEIYNMPVDDLPLHVNRVWLKSDHRDLYLERLKKEELCPTP